MSRTRTNDQWEDEVVAAANRVGLQVESAAVGYGVRLSIPRKPFALKFARDVDDIDALIEKQAKHMRGHDLIDIVRHGFTLESASEIEVQEMEFAALRLMQLVDELRRAV